MAAYVNTHIQLEARRDAALAQGARGPRYVYMCLYKYVYVYKSVYICTHDKKSVGVVV